MDCILLYTKCRTIQLETIFTLRKGKGVSGWYSLILTIPYRGRWVVLDHPYVRKQAQKGFRTKARDGDFIEFKLILMEFFNSNQKTELLPIGKVDRFQ